MSTKNSLSATILLQGILEAFPQADPKSDFYGEPIKGTDAVDFLSEIVPEIRKCLDAPAPKVAVILDGGIVQCLTCDRPDDLPPITFMDIDYDTEGAAEDGIIEVPQGDDEKTVSKAFASFTAIGQAKIDLEAVVKQLKEK